MSRTAISCAVRAGPERPRSRACSRWRSTASKRDDPESRAACASCVADLVAVAPSLDVVEIDAASNRGVDDARELRERAMYAPSGENRWKVYIIDEAHMLTREAWNALLKILEEPPPRVVFVFATTEPQKIAQFAAPVLSRLQRFDFKRISALGHPLPAWRRAASEKVEADPDALAHDRTRRRRLDARCAEPDRPGARVSRWATHD